MTLAEPPPTRGATAARSDLPTGVVTFLFADIEGSTRLLERHGERYRTALLRHHAVLQEAVGAQGGVIFETIGDAHYAAFHRPSCALLAAIQVQRDLALAEWAALENDRLRVRMGIHAGEVERWGDHYFGPPLYRADRLMSLGHGGQVLLSSPAAELVRDSLPSGVSLTDMGEHRLKDLQRPDRVFQLLAPGLEVDFPPLRTLQNRPTNLPPQATPFIGRERECDLVRHQLLGRPDVRLVTLLGPGGTGKTRLALQVAADALDDFPDGVFFVPLARLTDPDQILTLTAQALGVREVTGEPLLHTLTSHLRERTLLLVLDNFEHLLAPRPDNPSPAGAARVADLLDACPRLKVLVTSREVLRLYGEHEYTVPPLSLPDPTRLPTLERLAQYEAVRLFVERAQEVSPGFVLDAENARAIAEICQRLDGLPLAIELAAARVRLLPPQAMLERMGGVEGLGAHRDRTLPLLTGGARNLPVRQQTLRSAIAWSYDLLTPDEQTLLRRLSLFTGGCSLESAEAVGAGLDALALLDSLVSKSLLKQQAEDGWDEGPRFFMLQTIREFARESLDAAGESDATHRGFLEHFAALTLRGRPALRTAKQSDWLERFDRERYNLRAALRWCLAHPADPDVTDAGLRLAGGAWLYWHVRGYLGEGAEWLTSLLRLPHAQAPTVSRAFALTGLGVLTWYQGQQATARAQLEASVALFRQLDNARGLASALAWLGHVLQRLEPKTARALLEEALGIARALEDLSLTARALNILGEIARQEGDSASAGEYYEESLALARQAGHQRRIAATLHNLGHVAHRGGDTAAAAARFRETLPIAQALGDQHAIALCLAGLAGVSAARSEGEAAATLFGAVGALLECLRATFDPADQEEYLRNLTHTRELLPDGLYQAAIGAGRAMTAEEAIAYALRLRAA